MIAAAMGWIGTFGTIGAYVMLSRGQLALGLAAVRRPQRRRRPPVRRCERGVRRLAERRLEPALVGVASTPRS